MTDRLRNVKPCEIQWIGTMPPHWSCRRLKHVASVALSSVDKKSHEQEEPVRLCNYVDVYYHERITSELDFMQATAAPDEVRRFTLRAGDVLITKDSEAWDDIAVPAYVPSDLDGVVCGYHLAQVRPLNGLIDGEYLSRSFAARGINDQFRVAANGITRFGIGKYWIDNSLFLVPPIDEQRAIAAFLDRETARIDALIDKKRRQIELLHERRAALISHAVTRGLDPNAPMKDSGIAWLGQVPEAWTVVQLRRALRRIEQGWSPQCENRQAEEGEWGVLKAGCANHGRFDEGEHKALPADIEPERQYEIRLGDLLMSRACGTPTLVGSVAIVESCRPRLLLCDKVFRLHPEPRAVDVGFLYLALNSRTVRFQVEQSLSGAEGLANNITQESIKGLVLALPPRAEQKSISATVRTATSKTDAVVCRVRLSIDRLREYRTALISAAVTGQIDVRQEVA